MSSLTVEVLNRWRAVQRYLTALPDDAPGRPAAVALVEQLRLQYADLTARAERSLHRVEQAEAAIARADELLLRSQDRIAATQAPAYPRACQGAGPHVGAITYRLADGRYLCAGCLRQTGTDGGADSNG